MSTLYFRNAGETSHEEVSDFHPLPVSVLADVQSQDINGSTSQVAVQTAATLIAPANPRRRAILITAITGTQVTYIGFTSGVSAASGHYLQAAAGSSITIYAKNAIYGIAVTAAQTVSVMEEEFVA